MKTKSNSRTTQASLKKRIAELEAKLEKPIEETSNTNSPILSDDNIAVMSLCPFKLNLLTEPMGRGKTYSFEGFGSIKRIPYADINQIINNQSTFMEKGYFYILDERVIRKHGLNYIYDTILDKERLETIFSLSSMEAVELYKSASNSQKEIINRYIMGKVAREEEIDLNIVSKISKISGIDLIAEGTEAREYLIEKED